MDVNITKDMLGDETEADLSAWLVADGDEVSENEVIAEIETAKVAFGVEAPAAGKISIIVEAGDVFEVGATIARIV